MSQAAYPRHSSGSGAAPPQESRFRRRDTVRLSLSSLVTSVIVLIIGLSWVFAFGVIVGRGQNPEQEMPGLASLLPPPPREEAKPEILRPEELTFMSDLKQRPALGADPRPQTAPPRSEPAAASGRTPDPDRAKRAQPPGTDVRYDFVFQIVAYKNSGQADTLRERLEGQGMRTRMTIERNAAGKPKWYRVQVLLRGTEADAARIREELGRAGLKDAILASRKPAP